MGNKGFLWTRKGVRRIRMRIEEEGRKEERNEVSKKRVARI